MIYVLPPIVAFVVSIIFFLLITYSFHSKPWNLKGWLISSVFLWMPWSGFTILLRYASSENLAIWYLRFSFISLQVLLYASYRFHHLMVFKPTDNRFATFGLAIITGFNIVLSFDQTYLHVKSVGEYYTDSFHPLLMITNIVGANWGIYWVIRALSRMDALALFYDKRGRQKAIPIFFLISLMGATVLLSIIWLFSNERTDSTPFILIVIFGFIFIGVTYGINPNSTILAPQRLWGFLIVTNAGLPVFEHHFSKDERIGELALIAMAITASNTIVVSHFASDSYVNEVVLEDRAILIEQVDELMFCLIADYSSLQLQIVLNEAVKRIVEHIDFKPTYLGDKYGKFSYVDQIIRDIFQTSSLESRVRRFRTRSS
ncbi:MAG: hypothetical protein IH840_13815 [Candidatus Heimdallarchaeota archaeon]|nr:hypothetical protein [Candidatus Heimdallarchaeota archaeon]